MTRLNFIFYNFYNRDFCFSQEEEKRMSLGREDTGAVDSPR